MEVVIKYIENNVDKPYKEYLIAFITKIRNNNIQFKQEISELKKENRDLRENILQLDKNVNELHEMVINMPNGPVYNAAKYHFKDLGAVAQKLIMFFDKVSLK